MEKFNVLCSMLATYLGDCSPEQFETDMLEELGIRVKYYKDYQTDIVYNDGKNRIDLLFYIHDDDIPIFAVKRLQTNIKWVSDYPGVYTDL